MVLLLEDMNESEEAYWRNVSCLQQLVCGTQVCHFNTDLDVMFNLLQGGEGVILNVFHTWLPARAVKPSLWQSSSS